jgi:hypothetical protein
VTPTSSITRRTRLLGPIPIGLHTRRGRSAAPAAAEPFSALPVRLHDPPATVIHGLTASVTHSYRDRPLGARSLERSSSFATRPGKATSRERHARLRVLRRSRYRERWRSRARCPRRLSDSRTQGKTSPLRLLYRTPSRTSPCRPLLTIILRLPGEFKPPCSPRGTAFRAANGTTLTA